MKQYPYRFKLSKWQLEWGQSEVTVGTDHYFYYFMVSRMTKANRAAWRKVPLEGFCKVLGTNLVGLQKMWHDSPHAVLNLYFIQISWSTPWTTIPKDYWK